MTKFQLSTNPRSRNPCKVKPFHSEKYQKKKPKKTFHKLKRLLNDTKSNSLQSLLLEISVGLLTLSLYGIDSK